MARAIQVGMTIKITLKSSPAPPVANKATRKLVEERAIREVSRAITAWYYSR